MDLWYVNLDDDGRPTGKPINKHSSVAVIAIRTVLRNTVKNVSSKTST